MPFLPPNQQRQSTEACSSSDNILPLPPDNHNSTDAVYCRRETLQQNKQKISRQACCIMSNLVNFANVIPLGHITSKLTQQHCTKIQSKQNA